MLNQNKLERQGANLFAPQFETKKKVFIINRFKFVEFNLLC